MEQSTVYQYRKKKIRAREIVLLALLTALVVFSSILCAVTVPIHLGTALVIMIGASMDYKAGACVGAMAMLLNNFYLGQGVWTPFQMIAMGLLGALAGLFFSGKKRTGVKEGRKRAIFMATFTFLVIPIVYGGIMNFQTFLFSGFMMGTSGGLNKKSLLAYYISGIPYDLKHGSCAALAVLLLEESFTQKLERIKLKYGFYR